MPTLESNDLLVTKLSVKDDAPWKVTCLVDMPNVNVKAGQPIFIFGRAHGDPRQKKDRKECNWGTYIRVWARYSDDEWPYKDLYKAMGRDLYYAQKGIDQQAGFVTFDFNTNHIVARYYQRAINRVKGGYMKLDKVHLKVAC